MVNECPSTEEVKLKEKLYIYFIMPSVLWREKTSLLLFFQILMPCQLTVQRTVCKLCRWEVCLADQSHHDSGPLQHRGPSGPQMGSQKLGDPHYVCGKDSWTISDSGDVWLLDTPSFTPDCWCQRERSWCNSKVLYCSDHHLNINYSCEWMTMRYCHQLLVVPVLWCSIFNFLLLPMLV